MAGDLDALVDAWHDPGAWQGMTKAGPFELPGEVAGVVALDELVLHGWDLAVANALRAHGADVLLLAGYLRKLGPRSLRTMSGPSSTRIPPCFRSTAGRECTARLSTKLFSRVVIQRVASRSTSSTSTTMPVRSYCSDERLLNRGIRLHL